MAHTHGPLAEREKVYEFEFRIGESTVEEISVTAHGVLAFIFDFWIFDSSVEFQ